MDHGVVERRVGPFFVPVLSRDAVLIDKNFLQTTDRQRLIALNPVTCESIFKGRVRPVAPNDSKTDIQRGVAASRWNDNIGSANHDSRFRTSWDGPWSICRSLSTT